MSGPEYPIWLRASLAAPKPGVFVMAPQSTPTSIGRSSFSKNNAHRMSITAMFNTTTPVAMRFIVTPPFLNEEKNEGPTWRPMQKTNRMRPKSCTKFRISRLPVNPKCPIRMPTNKMNVTPKETPNIFSFPKSTPPAMTNE